MSLCLDTRLTESRAICAMNTCVDDFLLALSRTECDGSYRDMLRLLIAGATGGC